MTADDSVRRVLVTGAAGFIGYHTCARLLAAGRAVLGIDELNPYYDVALKEARRDDLLGRDGFGFECFHVGDAARLKAAFERFRPHAVVHLAAQVGVRYSLIDPAAYTRSNIDGFLAVLEACRAHPVRHLVYASSSSVYGANSKTPFAETDPVDSPISLYSATKRANELMARTYAHLFGLPASGLRFFTVYGPWGRPDMAYFSFTKAILEGRPIDVFNGGKLWRDFTYVDDVTSAIALLLERPPTPERRAALGDTETAPHLIYNVGNNDCIELGDFVAAIERAVGRKAVKIMRPMQPGDVPLTNADTRRLAAVTGFAPSTPLDVGLGRFVAWYRRRCAT